MKNNWTATQKFVFLFLAIYLFFYTDIIGWIFGLSFENIIWDKIVPTFAAFVGSTKEVISTKNGSGDTSFDYYLFFFLMLLSLVLALLVFMVDRKRANYNLALKWLMILLRYYLFLVLLSYGLNKVFTLQFPKPDSYILDNTYGESYPMTLLWTFMGYSTPYQIFGGMLELIGGIFLLSRKTVKLGILICLGVMTNVMMLNYCYDVCVKLFSTHLVFICLLLALFYSKDFINFFIQNETTHPVKVEDIIPEKLQKHKFYFKWIVLVTFFAYSIYTQNELRKKYHLSESKFNGEYVVEKYHVYSNDNESSLKNDSLLWSSLHINNRLARIQHRDVLQVYQFNLNGKTKSFIFKETYDAPKNELSYKYDGKHQLILSGTFNNDSIYVKLLKKQLKYRLLRGKFRWVQEQPREPY